MSSVNPWSELSGTPVVAHQVGEGDPRRPSVAGVRVLVPRASREHPICRALERRGAIPVPLELTRLEPASPAAIGHALALLAASAWALFLTERAVGVLAADGRPLTPLIGFSRLTSKLAVGAATPGIAGALAALDVPVDLTPLRGEGAVPLVMSMPPGPLRAVPPAEAPPGPEGSEPDGLAPLTGLPELPALPAHLEDALPRLSPAAAALLTAPAAAPAPAAAGRAGASARAAWEIPTREKRVALLGSDVIDPTAIALTEALGWEPEAVALHTTQPAPLSRVEIGRALAHRSAGRPRWPGIVLLTSPATVRALLGAIGRPPTEVAVAAADERTARAALAAGLRVDAIAANTTHDAFAAACQGAWERAWDAGVLR